MTKDQSSSAKKQTSTQHCQLRTEPSISSKYLEIVKRKNEIVSKYTTKAGDGVAFDSVNGK